MTLPGRYRPPVMVTRTTKTRLCVATLLCLLLPAAFFMASVPPPWDVLELRSLSRFLVGALIGAPIWLLDACTGGAFAARNEGFIGFPSAVQLGFALLADLVVFWLIACALVRRAPVPKAETVTPTV